MQESSEKAQKNKEIQIFIFTNTLRLIGETATTQTTLAVTCTEDTTLDQFITKLYMRYLERFPKTFEQITRQQFNDDLALIHRGRRIYNEIPNNSKSLTELGINHEATLHHVCNFGSQPHLFAMGNERARYLKLRQSDPVAADLMVSAVQPPKAFGDK